MKAWLIAVFAVLVLGSVCHAEEPAAAGAFAPVVLADWQEPQALPRRFRNHCGYDAYSGRPYCSDHCGYQYQFYHCSRESFGCCRVGFGYCDWTGLLRCHP
jgi:hypothetical protein